MKRILLISAAVATCLCCPSSQLCSKTAADVTATVQFSDGQTVTVTDFSTPIGIQPSEVVNITLQFPSDAVGDLVKVAADGGSTSLGSNVAVIGNNGTITFAFHASGDSGPKSVNVQSTSGTFSLQFSVSAGQG